MNYLIFGTFGLTLYTIAVYVGYTILNHEPDRVYYKEEDNELYVKDYCPNGILIGDL